MWTIFILVVWVVVSVLAEGNEFREIYVGHEDNKVFLSDTPSYIPATMGYKIYSPGRNKGLYTTSENEKTFLSDNQFFLPGAQAPKTVEAAHIPLPEPVKKATREPVTMVVRRELASKIQTIDGLVHVGDEPTPFTGIIFSQYPNGQLKNEITYENGKKNGASKTRFETDGRLETEGTFKDGKENGIFKAYYASGKLQSEETFVDGKKNGLCKTYYETNGPLKNVAAFANSKIGQPESEATYKDDNLDGVFKLWDENGKLQSEVTYKDGERIKK